MGHFAKIISLTIYFTMLGVFQANKIIQFEVDAFLVHLQNVEMNFKLCGEWIEYIYFVFSFYNYEVFQPTFWKDIIYSKIF